VQSGPDGGEGRIATLQDERFSRTAHGVAVRRAAHQLFDQPRVLDDPLALPIIGREATEKLRASPRVQSSTARAFRAFMAARSRYAEDQLAKAVAQGVKQFVVLGAGLDTFAYRNPYSDLRVFEVDHPATQAWKRGRLQDVGIAVPQSLIFVPVDFEQQTLATELQRGGLDHEQPAFFSWLGVTPYLTRESCMATLGFIGKMPSGSGVAFDFAVDPKLLGLKQRLALFVLSRRVAAAGEPFQLFFRPEELVKELKQLGFRSTEILGVREINERYFNNRGDGLRVGGDLGKLMGAWV
jgi:methyltransferase (TIGR00027 family)